MSNPVASVPTLENDRPPAKAEERKAQNSCDEDGHEASLERGCNVRTDILHASQSVAVGPDWAFSIRRPRPVGTLASVQDGFARVAHRLQADLRTQFPNVSVRFVEDGEGGWKCRVEDGGDQWGDVATWVEEGEELAPDDIEHLLLDVASNIADNLWPDELTDPWPRCPHDRDHLLHPRLRRGRAVWACLHEDSVAIRIGDLSQ